MTYLSRSSPLAGVLLFAGCTLGTTDAVTPARLLPSPIISHGVELRAEQFTTNAAGQVNGMRGVARNSTDKKSPHLGAVVSLLDDEQNTVGAIVASVEPLPPAAEREFLADIVSPIPCRFVATRTALAASVDQIAKAMASARQSAADLTPTPVPEIWKNRICEPERGEFETREQRDSRWSPPKPGEIIHFNITPEKSPDGRDGFFASYDIDTQTLRVGLKASDYNSGIHIFDPATRGDVLLRGAVALIHDETVSETKVGQTAGGAQTAMRTTRGDLFFLVISNPLTFFAINGLPVTRESARFAVNYCAHLKISPIQAQHVKESLLVRIGVSFHDRPAARTDHLSKMATFTSPTENSIKQNYVECDLREFVLIDSRSNTILGAWAIPAP